MDQGKHQVMAGVVPEPRAAAADSGFVTKDTADDFEFCVMTAGGLVPSGAADMCVSFEVFSQGKLLPLCPSSTAAGDAAGLVLLARSELAASTVGSKSIPNGDSRQCSIAADGTDAAWRQWIWVHDAHQLRPANENYGELALDFSPSSQRAANQSTANG
ncbi:hypothetical protein OsI_05408 [Oryza sativa Indica Group]|jgi:hypothetical protein|uniref:Uncharacterized protein n=1 Tax=Oryza sativa subsp. indica TaxID=39946 RepID=A2WZM1_ORYSI|nr:hypothetical protein OsI_05408 [Oryza sativa Indica Group]